MKFIAKSNGFENTGEHEHVGNFNIGTKVAGVADSVLDTLTSQAKNLLTDTVNNLVSDTLDDVFEGGLIDIAGLDIIKDSISFSIQDTLRSAVSNTIDDSIESLTNNVGSFNGVLTNSLSTIKSDMTSILTTNIAHVTNLSAITSRLDSIVDNRIQTEVYGVVDNLKNNFGKSVNDIVGEGIAGALGQDLVTQLGDQAAAEIMNGLSGFKLTVGTALKRSIVGQGSLLVGSGSKLVSIAQGALTLGAGSSLIKLASGAMSIGSGSSKISIGEGDIRIGGESIAFKSPIVTLNVTGDATGTANTTLENLADGTLALTIKNSGIAVFDNGIAASGTKTFNVDSSRVHKVEVTGSHTWAFSSWPAGYTTVRILVKNGGLGTITFPTINWYVGDGTSTTNFATSGVTLQSSGTNTIDVWSPDGGVTLYGSAL